MESIINLNGQDLTIKHPETIIELQDVAGRLSFFRAETMKYVSNSESDTMTVILKNISESVGTIYSLVGEEKLKRIYFPATDETAYRELSNILNSKEVFTKGTKQRKIIMEIQQAYSIYKAKQNDYLGFDMEDGLPLFREPVATE